ncbi:MAG: gliding motility protein GldN [Muribaculaceae bacterium]|nr:gliding motility protein GldN [Muribaculaceae bacterium]
MKKLKYIIAFITVVLAASTVQAQVVKKSEENDRKKKAESGVVITDRQQAFFEQRQPSDADLQWMKVIYRSLDLTKGKNPALYYPEEPNEDGQSLFFIIMRLLANNQLTAYEYLDGREMFTDEFKVSVSELLDRFHIMYEPAKGSTEKNPKYTIEDADIPGNEVLSYYIIERWEFDTRSNAMKTRVEAVCPVLHRTDEFGGEAIKYPMFWVKLNDIRPYMANQYVFTDDDNNLPRYSLDDFFKLNMYTGEIYKTKNLRNLSLMQQFPEEKALKHAQDSIERRLQAFNNDLWVPDREVLLAQKQAREELERQQAEADGEETGDEVSDDKQDDKKSSVKRSTKRGAKSKDKESTTKKSSNKKTNIKQRKPKTTSASTSATRSVRNRKRK